MKAKFAYFHCGEHLKKTLGGGIGEVEFVIASVKWANDFHYFCNGKEYKHQAGYNKAFAVEFVNRDWEL